MALFQESVLKNYLKQQDATQIEKAYKKYVKYFHNPTIQQNIKDSKEEQFQEGFLRELLVNIFGYVLRPNPDFNLTTEFKNEKGAKKADGAILKDDNALAVIELKGTKTKDLESIRQQAFDYKANQTGCVYVITSNFEKLRFYINNAVDFEEFNLFTLNQQQFALMYLCLHKDNLLNNLALKINKDSLVEEEEITKKFYSDYSSFKRELYRDLVKQNMKNEIFREELNKENNEKATKTIKLNLFKKSQKLIDRFLFIFFAEDRGLLPPNSTLKILEQWNKLKELDEEVPLYKRYIKYFNYLDTGRKGTDKVSEIFAYNGGLFKPDPILDSLLIDDELLYKHTKALANYDFESQVDVNILGHIFENSLNEIESVNAEIEGSEFDKQKNKRKKDGIFYTPKYITKYIVDNTVGKLCSEKKTELGIFEEEYFKNRKGRPVKTLKALQEKLESYRKWMLSLTILDPACGSGAFLNQALDFLIKEHRYIDELQASLLGGSIVFQNIENTILENNIYGVDLNEESVEIAKLSLWLRTAQPRRQLNVLSNNIKCGNSLIDDKVVAGDKAFNWQEEFPQIFKTQQKKIEEKEIEEKPDYLGLIEENAKLAQKKAEQSVELSKQAIEYSKKVYEYTQKQKSLAQETENLYGINKNGFDVVIGNPPYGAKISKKEQKYLNNQYIKGGSETVISFLKLSDSILKHKGILSFIIPKSFSYATNYNEIRTFLKNQVTEIVDCQKVWKEVKLEQVIVTFTKSKSFDYYHTSILENKEVKKIGKIRKYTFEKYGFFLNNIDNKELELANKLTKNDLYLNDISTNSRGGIFQKYLTDEGDFEVLGGAEIQRYGIAGIKGKIKKEFVENDTKTIIKENSVLVQNIVAHIENPKPHIKITACLPHNLNYRIVDTINQIVVQTNYSHKYIWILLNSKLINWYAYRFIFGKAIRTMHFDSPVSSKIPFKQISIHIQQTFIEKANLMLSLNIELQKKSEKFIKRIKSNFEIEKTSNKLQKFYNFDFKTFVAELKKQKTQLNLQQQDEWEVYFDSYKQEINNLQQQINQTDKEIDRMVYELYELTDEEIEIVEKSVN